jgi:hypothetical protein
MNNEGSKLTRRRALLVAGSFIAGLTLSISLWRTPRFERLLKRHTWFLKLAPGTARAFSREFQAHITHTQGKKAWLDYLAGLEREDFVFPLGLFLMSTDFFLNGADETRTVRFLEFYDPYRGCRNPFARFD